MTNTFLYTIRHAYSIYNTLLIIFLDPMHHNFVREVMCSVWYLKAVIEALGFGLDLSCIFQNPFIQNQSFTPFLHQNIGLSYIETPVRRARTQTFKKYSSFFYLKKILN